MDSQSFDQIAVCFAHDMRDFLGGPLPAHGSPRGSVYRRTPISAGPVFGEQATYGPGPENCPESCLSAAPDGYLRIE